MHNRSSLEQKLGPAVQQGIKFIGSYIFVRFGDIFAYLALFFQLYNSVMAVVIYAYPILAALKIPRLLLIIRGIIHVVKIQAAHQITVLKFSVPAHKGLKTAKQLIILRICDYIFQLMPELPSAKFHV